MWSKQDLHIFKPFKITMWLVMWSKCGRAEETHAGKKKKNLISVSVERPNGWEGSAGTEESNIWFNSGICLRFERNCKKYQDGYTSHLIEHIWRLVIS